MLSKEQKDKLLKLARTTVEKYIIEGIIPKFDDKDPLFAEKRGAFVTIHNKGSLRGCIGMIEGAQPLSDTIIEMAIEASTKDPRFMPVAPEEIKDLDIEISVLTPKRKVKSTDEIELGKHGVIVKKGSAGGVYLPQVATETGWTKEQFMESLCSGKAGLPPDAYKDPKTEIYVFEAEVFGERQCGKE
ncbi:MAG: AmmeMemoRadiSam system protein A [Oligoflexia bacterium]|nr:AmmeMemoRadiSam system protein A [Oligoflexia bacterium]